MLGGAGNDTIRLIGECQLGDHDGGTGTDTIDVSASTVADVDIEDGRSRTLSASAGSSR